MISFEASEHPPEHPRLSKERPGPTVERGAMSTTPVTLEKMKNEIMSFCKLKCMLRRRTAAHKRIHAKDIHCFSVASNLGHEA